MKRKASEYEADKLPFKVMVLRSRYSKRVLYLECGKDFLDMLLRFLTKPIRDVLKLLDDGGLLSDANKGLLSMYTSLKTLGPSTLSVGKEVLFGTCDSRFENVFLSDPEEHEFTCFRPFCTNIVPMEKVLYGDCDLAWIFRCRICEKKTAMGADGRPPVRCDYCPESSVAGMTETKSSLKLYFEVEAKPESEQLQRPLTSDCKSKVTGKKKGFVKKNVTFMVKEDLSISTAGVLKSMSVLQTSMQVENIKDLDIREVSVGEHEVLLLIRSALVSNAPLTEVFGPLFDSKGFTTSPLTECLILCRVCLFSSRCNSLCSIHLRSSDASYL
ncbi:hypothetical protein R1sor_021466 [Riccia sorocarpa]|uniref:Uncharacterized protein n=1 Tax=Riccia sorocarpa TaxID=122646 RepID=A0ABD3GH50_9MARC